MTLLVVAIGLYAIGMVGFSHILNRRVMQMLGLKDNSDASLVYWIMVGLASIFWFPAVYWELMREAVGHART